MNIDTSILLSNGTYFDFERPGSAGRFGIHAIAHSLCRISRFVGHTLGHPSYSVAQHSVLVSGILPTQYALAGLLHDIAEAFTGDVATPMKILCPDVRAIEERIERALFPRYGLTFPIPTIVKTADLILLATERRDLMPKSKVEWRSLANIQPLVTRIKPWGEQKAETLFIETFEELTKKSLNSRLRQKATACHGRHKKNFEQKAAKDAKKGGATCQ